MLCKESESDVGHHGEHVTPFGIRQQLQEIAERANIPFFKILDRLVEFNIPSIDLDRYDVTSRADRKSRYNRHPLGTGHSCAVIQHLTIRDVPLRRTVLKAGTPVALKIYRAVDQELRATGKNESQRRVCRSLLQEIEILSAPQLKVHENICQLLFVGWLEDTPIPAVALELAAFGSLEDVLIAASDGLTHVQKIHTTVDIGKGLAAIHACGFIHGDLKPGNVVLSQHETRQLVAKITDFGGSGDAAAYSADTRSGGPVFATPTWSAPETVHHQSPINWQKADSYAYGLIVASIWARPEQWFEPRASSCILEFMLELDLDADEKRDFLLLMKLQPDSNENSVVQLCRRWIRCRQLDVRILLCDIICGTLSRDQAGRTAVAQMLNTLVRDLSTHAIGAHRSV